MDTKKLTMAILAAAVAARLKGKWMTDEIVPIGKRGAK